MTIRNVATAATTALLSSSEATAVIIFNVQDTWSVVDSMFRVNNKHVLTEADMVLSLTTYQAGPLVLTTNTVYVGACAYHSATGITGSTLSTVLQKNGVFVVLQDTFYFNCIVTVQPVTGGPTYDTMYPIGTLIACEGHFTLDQSILRAED